MHAVTVVSEGYQAYGIVAGESFLRHNPGSQFTIVTAGCSADPFRGRGMHVISDSDLALTDLAARRRRYNDFEYVLSLKATVLKAVQQSGDVGVYLDGDLYTVASYAGLDAAFAGQEVLLVPHISSTLPEDGLWPSLTSILTVGVINGGFVAVTDGSNARSFLDWWEARLTTGCRDDPKRGMYVDQRWLDLAITLFPTLRISPDPAWNLGHWNVWGTNLRRGATGWSVDGNPLRAFHFSGFDPLRPTLLSRHQNRVLLTEGSPLGVLCLEYAEALLAAGHETFAKEAARRYGDLGHRLMPLARATAGVRARLGRG